jgi:hypothetical protein
LKELLSNAPILKIENINETFVVCIDACKQGLGEVLRMERKIFMSPKFLKNMRGITTHMTWILLNPYYMH